MCLRVWVQLPTSRSTGTFSKDSYARMCMQNPSFEPSESGSRLSPVSLPACQTSTTAGVGCTWPFPVLGESQNSLSLSLETPDTAAIQGRGGIIYDAACAQLYIQQLQILVSGDEGSLQSLERKDGGSMGLCHLSQPPLLIQPVMQLFSTNLSCTVSSTVISDSW